MKIDNNIGKSKEKTQLLQFVSSTKAALLVNFKLFLADDSLFDSLEILTQAQAYIQTLYRRHLNS